MGPRMGARNDASARTLPDRRNGDRGIPERRLLADRIALEAGQLVGGAQAIPAAAFAIMEGDEHVPVQPFDGACGRLPRTTWRAQGQHGPVLRAQARRIGPGNLGERRRRGIVQFGTRPVLVRVRNWMSMRLVERTKG